MRRPFLRLLAAIFTFVGILSFTGQNSLAYDQQVYNNLLKSKDALVTQQAELQRAYDETQKQIDALNAKLGRLDTYLKQVNTSIKDVDTALMYARQ